MELRPLGRSGLKVSTVSLGCNNFGWRIGKEEARAVLDAALGAGINFLDTANIYGGGGTSEAILGEIMGKRREDVVLASKFGMKMPDGSLGADRRYIVKCVEDSLQRLRTDRIDLYQLHQPDPTTHIDETLRALDDLIRAGKVLYIGSCNLSPWQVVEAEYVAREIGTHRFISVQDELSVLIRDKEESLLPALQAIGVGLLPYFPLASGLLTGKYARGATFPEDSRFAKIDRLADRYLTERNWARTEALAGFCEARGKTLLDLAFSWLLTRPTVASVMAGATRPEQIVQNVAAASWTLGAEDLAAIDAITGPNADG